MGAYHVRQAIMSLSGFVVSKVLDAFIVRRRHIGRSTRHTVILPKYPLLLLFVSLSLLGKKRT